MPLRLLTQAGLSLCLAAMAAGCSSPPTSVGSLQCQISPSSCMYDGRYEPGEKEYAEAKAKELNREAANKLRRSAAW